MSLESPAGLQVRLGDLAFPESPRWYDGRLWVSDWGAGEVITVDMSGRKEVVSRLASLTCIAHLPDGRLLIVAPADGALLRREANGSVALHSDLSPLGQNPWNDIVVDGRGNAYVNNIGFDFPTGEFAPGIVALVGADGVARLAADGLAFPNGMAVTPDNRTLVVAESYGQELTAFDIAGDGTLSNRRTWARLGDHPDGICLDADGAVWYADVTSQRCVRVREGGDILQVVELDRGCFACALGGPDRRTLFMAVNRWAENAGDGARMGQIVSTQVGAGGVGWP